MSFKKCNARSLKTIFHKIKDNILELNVKFDIIAITETWIKPGLINDFNIKNYDAFHITFSNELSQQTWESELKTDV